MWTPENKFPTSYDNIGKMVGQKKQHTVTYEVVHACVDTGMLLLRCESQGDGRRKLMYHLVRVEDWLDGWLERADTRL